MFDHETVILIGGRHAGTDDLPDVGSQKAGALLQERIILDKCLVQTRILQTRSLEIKSEP